MKPVVFIPEPIAARGLDLLKSECQCLTPWDGDAQLDPEAASQAEAVIVRLFQVDAQFIEQSPDLKVIAKHGVGVDNIDLEAANAHGIPVVYTPTANANAVAEHTLALMLALSRWIVPASAAIHDGRFSERGKFQGVELAGKTLGVIGLGRVGVRVAQMAANGLGMEVLAYDPFVDAARYAGPAILADSLEAVLRASDFLTLHVALSPETRHLINERTLLWLKADCRLINTSRGAVVDEVALLQALVEGRLAGAALDVFEEEPLPPDHPLVSAPHVLLTPHISSSTQESLDRMSLHAAQGVLDVLNGRRPEFIFSADGSG